MPHVPFNPDDIDWTDYFQSMCAQHGGGSAPYFVGSNYQRGAGIGSIFASMVRFLTPIVTAAAWEIERKGLAVGSRILSGVSQGRSMQRAAFDEMDERTQNLTRRNDIGAGIQKYIDKGHRQLQRGKGRLRHSAYNKSRRHRRPAPMQFLGKY